MKRLATLLMLTLLLLGTSAAFGSDVLYWIDATGGIDRMEEALSDDSLGLTVTLAEDYNDFEAWVASRDWDLIVLTVQNHNLSGYDGFSNFVNYIDDGGKAIFCAWDAEGSDAYFYALFGAIVTGNRNETSVTVSSDALASGLPSNPMTLANNGGWGNFSVGLSPVTSDDIEAASFANGESAIVISNEGKTIINGFLPDAPSNDVLYVNEISYLLDISSDDTSSGGSSGCNMMALVPSGLLLLAPLTLLLKKSR